MFDWLYSALHWLNQTFGAVVQWLEQFVIGVPIYMAGPAMTVIGALDSSLLSLPEINDYLVVMRCTNAPYEALYFPLFAAAGSVIGCMLLYTLVRSGGQYVVRKRFRAEHIERVERTYAKFGFLALAVPAMLPPPMPFKIFVATAGALEYPRWRFMLTVMIARSVRYFVEGTLAVFYGEQVLVFMRDNGLYILSGVGALVVVGVGGYVLVKHIRTPRRTAVEIAEESGAEVRTDGRTAE